MYTHFISYIIHSYLELAQEIVSANIHEMVATKSFGASPMPKFCLVHNFFSFFFNRSQAAIVALGI